MVVHLSSSPSGRASPCQSTKIERWQREREGEKKRPDQSTHLQLELRSGITADPPNKCFCAARNGTQSTLIHRRSSLGGWSSFWIYGRKVYVRQLCLSSAGTEAGADKKKKKKSEASQSQVVESQGNILRKSR